MERAEFCGHLLKAASDMGMVARLDEIKGRFILHIADPISQGVISGKLSETKEEALESACNKLVDSISIKQ